MSIRLYLHVLEEILYCDIKASLQLLLGLGFRSLGMRGFRYSGLNCNQAIPENERQGRFYRLGTQSPQSQDASSETPVLEVPYESPLKIR